MGNNLWSIRKIYSEGKTFYHISIILWWCEEGEGGGWKNDDTQKGGLNRWTENKNEKLFICLLSMF